ncbi:MAG: peptidylprolyl isomerase [Kiritimatiellia bacterium]
MRRLIAGIATLTAVSGSTAFAAAFDEGLAVEILRGETLQAAWQLAQTNPEVANRYIQSAVEQNLAMEAAATGLDERADVQDALQRARRQILVQAMREEHIRGIPAPAEADVKAHFEANEKNFKLAEAYRLTAVEWTGISAEHADRVSKLVAAGKASTNTLVAAKGRLVAAGGTNEWLNANNVIPPVWSKLGKIKDGEQTYIQTNEVMVVFTRIAHRPERQATFEEAKGSAAQALWNERRELSWRKSIEERAKKLTN